ncbi:hypothetical protein HHK36_001932 [Tetracentron sinense]|uniref:Uncharacterized protein n=1 Tax=Tetracentron sinense TaxID=13715 RepID=A0A834ZUX9_TETSI|nr:hypothetical protein HHK36_001932 [Tetracentron sinense]
MQRSRIPHTPTGERRQAQAELPVPGHKARRSSSSRTSPRLTCSQTDHPRSFNCSRRELEVPGKELRRRRADRVILRRALTPPVHRPSQRWWNFRPTPSRLSNMSMA